MDRCMLVVILGSFYMAIKLVKLVVILIGIGQRLGVQSNFAETTEIVGYVRDLAHFSRLYTKCWIIFRDLHQCQLT